MYVYNNKAKFGNVTVEVFRNSYRLRFRVLGKRYSMTIGAVCPDAYKVACAKAQEINSDILMERFDPTLAKYSPKHAHALEITETPKQEINLFEVWEQYKNINCSRVEKTSQETTWKNANRCVAKLSLKALLPSEVDLLIKEALENYSVGTLERVFDDLNAASNWAFKQKIISENYWNNLKAKLPKRQKSDKSNECFTLEERNAIIEGFKSNEFIGLNSKYSHSYYLGYVQMLAFTGARPEEMIALTWDDIKTRNGKTTIIINKAFTHGYLKGTKTGETRIFPVNNQLKAIIDKLPKIENPNNLVFPSVEGGYIDQHNFNNRYWTTVVKGLVAQGKVERYLSTYHLRHTYITLLVRAGVDIATIAAWVGNSKEMIFDHYYASNKDIVPPET